MLFTSISFLYYFLPIILIIYFLVPNKFKNIILDSEKYLNNKNNEKIDTLEIGVNLQ